MRLDERLKKLESAQGNDWPIAVNADNAEAMALMIERQKLCPSYNPIIFDYEDA